jgi:hypothetical protein
LNEYTSSVVQIHHLELDGTRRLLGAGFVVADGTLIVTCRHVLEPKGQALTFDSVPAFEVSLRVGEPCPALRVCNSPSASGLDVAFLRLNAAIDARPLPLTTIEGIEPRRVLNSYGFPNIVGNRAHAEVRILGRAPAEEDVPQLEGGASKDAIYQVYSEQLTSGFSGGPIWDPDRKAVVAVAQSVIAPDSLGQLAHTAYVIPADLLPKVFEELKLRGDSLPYVGLRPFSEHESRLFRGRTEELQQSIEHIRSFPRLIVLSGPSGSGKSSFVRAGVLAALRAANDDVVLSRIYPLIVVPRGETVHDELLRETSATSLETIVRDQLPLLKRDRLLLIVDQSERLLTSEINKDFLIEINRVIGSTEPVTVIFVVRTDFRDRLIDAVPARATSPCRFQELTVEMTRKQLKQIIAEPAAISDWPWPDDFIYLMIAACGAFRTRERIRAAAEATVLPLLQFTLSEIWRRRLRDPGRPMSEYYEDLGGLTGSISENATRYYNELPTDEQRGIVRSVLLDLITVSESETGPTTVTRRPCVVSRLRAVANDVTRERASRLVDELVDQHLLASSGLGYERVVEIVHDSLAANWELLNEWVTEAAAHLAFRQEVESARRKWIKSGKRPALLAGRGMVREGLDQAVGHSVWLTKGDIEYLAISRRRALRWLAAIPAAVLVLALIPVTSYWYPGIVPVLPAVSWMYPELDRVAPFIPSDRRLFMAAQNSSRRLTKALLVEAEWARDRNSCETSPWKYYRYAAPLADRCQLSVWDTSQAVFALTMSFQADDDQIRGGPLRVLVRALEPAHLVHPAGSRVGWPTSRDSGPSPSPLPARGFAGEDIKVNVRGGALMSYTDASPTFWSSLALGAIESFRPKLIEGAKKDAKLADLVRVDASITNQLASRFKLQNQRGAYVHVLYELDERGNDIRQLSTYASTMAFLAALHHLDPCSGAPLLQYPTARADVIESAGFFQTLARSTDWPMTEQMQGSGHAEALSFQIASAMLLADHSSAIALDARTEEVIRRLLMRSFAYYIGSRPSAEELDSYSATTRQSHITSTDGAADENTTFTWYPWALASAALYYDRQRRLHRSEQRVNEARRFLARLMQLEAAATSIALHDRTFQKTELLYAMSIVEGITGYYDGTVQSPFGPRDRRCITESRIHTL